MADFKATELSTNPGVYRFLDAEDNVLYVGKATNLRQRVRSYFDDDLIKTRGRFIVDMVTRAARIVSEDAPTVLDALIKEAALIKEIQPPYNTREKDNRSFTYIVITNEDYPRVLALRERTMAMGDEEEGQYKQVYGPFPSGATVRTLLSLVRRIIPFRDKCTPHQGKPCFHKQLGLCPGVCDGSISSKDYGKLVAELMLFFGGKREKLITQLEQQMKKAAKAMAFEEAAECKRVLFALTHINDVALITDETRLASQRSAKIRERAFRIEGYDIAHLFGTYTVGVMTVVHDGRPEKSQYRKFKIREEEGVIDDFKRLEEVLRRRFAHKEWQIPDVIVVDGGRAHLLRARRVLERLHVDVPVVALVKDDRHKAKAIIGNRTLAESYRPSIVLVNMEAHRFAVNYHRELREKLP
ncbi:MAG TPA: GIY-YIG nuclease family protein [Candidatus Paceibacterota bacterium]|nr:GIY-YIG nuclease family protein [Candidatus Paceibacterota bacterium]